MQKKRDFEVINHLVMDPNNTKRTHPSRMPVDLSADLVQGQYPYVLFIS